MSLSDLPKLLGTSVKPVQRQCLCTGFMGVPNNFGRSDYDMIGEKMLISTRCTHIFMSNLIKKSWTDSSVAATIWTTNTYRERKLIFTLTLLTTSHFRNLSYNRPRWYGKVCHVQKRFLTLKPNLICTYL